jgi:hypothetical protein
LEAVGQRQCNVGADAGNTSLWRLLNRATMFV